VAVSQGVINLLNLSLPALRQLAKDMNVKTGPNPTKADLVRALQNFPRAQLEAAVGDLLYAGNTSVTWIRIGDGMGFTVEELTKAILALEPGDPFAQELRPANITHAPSLVEARQSDPKKVTLTFVYRKRMQTYIRDFEIRTIYGDDFFPVIVRPEHGVFEIRASHDLARLLEQTWLRSLAEVMEKPIGYRLISIEDFNKLRKKLGAALDVYKGKDVEGSIYDTREWSKAKTCPDLATEARFQTDTKELEAVSQDILFVEEDPEHPVRLRVSANGSVWFRTVVSEAVIDRVYSALRSVGAV
jgi:hypothetical protein